jgi:tRNA 2-thiouridine synthesizing protein A
LKEAKHKTEPIRSADLTGEVCPMTIVKIKMNLAQIQPGEALEVVLDEGDNMKSVPRNVKDEGHKIVQVRSLGEKRYSLLIIKNGNQRN